MRYFKRNYRIAALTLITFFMVFVFFQNCSKSENTMKSARSIGYSRIDIQGPDGSTAAVVNGAHPAIGSPPIPNVVVTGSFPEQGRSDSPPTGQPPGGSTTYTLNLAGLAQCEDAPPRGNVTRPPHCCRLDPATNRIYRDMTRGNSDTCINMFFTCKRFPIDGDRWYERGWVDNWAYYDQIKDRISGSEILPEDGFADVRNCLGGWTQARNGDRVPNHCCVGKYLRNYCVRRNGEYPYGANAESADQMRRHSCIVEDPPTQSRPIAR